MPSLSVGRATNSSGYARDQRARGIGWRGLPAPTQISSPTGAFCMSTAEHREPYESRGSRTVLGARGGEIPLRDSPTPADLLHQPELARQTTRQLSGDPRIKSRDQADLGHDHQKRPPRAL